jgi:sugar (pentulose or hexulose) kinase
MSDLWCQIKADITGIPVTRMKNPTGAAFGDAVLAAVGVGAVESIEAFGAGLDRVDKEFEPTLDSALNDVYERGFEAYLETIAALTRQESGGDRG